MLDHEDKALRQAIGNIAATGDGQLFLSYLFDYLGYDKPMEQNKDVALHGVWVNIRAMVPVRDLVTIEHRELRAIPLTEELEKLWQTKKQIAEPMQASDQETEPPHNPFHRQRMNL